MMTRTLVSQLAGSLFTMLALGACASSGGTAVPGGSSLTDALASATTSSGELSCAPTDAQVTACDGKAASDTCTLTLDSGAVTGTCRASIDGSVGCAPNPPTPPATAVSACSGKASGDTCTLTSADDDDAGACATARDGVTLACARVFTPPQKAVDACATKASGDACTVDGHGRGGPFSGSCATSPSGTSSVLGCRPPSRFPDAAAACAGLATGDGCTLFAGHEHGGGTCAADTSGSVVCVMSCGGHEGGEHPDDAQHDGSDAGSHDHGGSGDGSDDHGGSGGSGGGSDDHPGGH